MINGELNKIVEEIESLITFDNIGELERLSTYNRINKSVNLCLEHTDKVNSLIDQLYKATNQDIDK